MQTLLRTSISLILAIAPCVAQKAIFFGQNVTVNSGASASDDFNRADSSTLGPNWTDDIAGIGIFSNHAKGTSGNQGSHWNAVTFATDQYAEVTFSTYANLGTCNGPAVRAGGGDFYWAVACGTTDIYVQRVIGGVNTGIATMTASITAGTVIRMEAIGTGASVTLRVYKDGVQLGSDISDSDASRLTSGQPGIGVQGAGSFVTAWTGGDL